MPATRKVPRPPVPRPEQDQAEAEDADQVVVVDVAAEQHEDAPGDQCEGDEAEAEDLADDLSHGHGASIPAHRICFAVHDGVGGRS